jgi:hypothetical protein
MTLTSPTGERDGEGVITVATGAFVVPFAGNGVGNEVGIQEVG